MIIKWLIIGGDLYTGYDLILKYIDGVNLATDNIKRHIIPLKKIHFFHFKCLWYNMYYSVTYYTTENSYLIRLLSS